jgi:hypothetical protein
MNHGRKRALVVSGAVATLLGAGALVMPTTAAGCPVNVICYPIEATSDSLGIIPDPTQIIVRDLYDQIVFPDDAAPVYSTLNATLAPTESTVYSLTDSAITLENEVSGEITPRLQELVDEADGPSLYGEDCEPKHDHKDHSNHKHCE